MVLGAGAGVGALTAQLQTSWTQHQAETLAASLPAEPPLSAIEAHPAVIVKRTRTVHVEGDPVIVYHYVPVPAQPSQQQAPRVPPTVATPTAPTPAAAVAGSNPGRVATPPLAPSPTLRPAPRPPSPAPQPAPASTTSTAS